MTRLTRCAVPKKSGWGVNEKVQEARDKQQQAKVEARTKETKAKEGSVACLAEPAGMLPTLL